MLTPEFALANYRDSDGAVRAGSISGGMVHRFPDRIGDVPIETLADVYAHWTALASHIETAPRTESRPIGEVELLAPSLQPAGIYCAGINYQDHIDAVYRKQNMPPEPSLLELGLPPWHFIKTQNTLRGHGSSIALFTDHIDWEIELAAIIGRTARNVSLEAALEYVAGYSVAIDLSARDRVMRPGMNAGSPFRYDWIAQKSFDGACPLGPWLVPATQIGDPGHLDLRLSVNGRIRQDSNTRHMLYSTAAQIAYLSTVITLSPGDVILTGTPAGTGFESDVYLRSGDIVSAAIGGIGELTITMA